MKRKYAQDGVTFEVIVDRDLDDLPIVVTVSVVSVDGHHFKEPYQTFLEVDE